VHALKSLITVRVTANAKQTDARKQASAVGDDGIHEQKRRNQSRVLKTRKSTRDVGLDPDFCIGGSTPILEIGSRYLDIRLTHQQHVLWQLVEEQGEGRGWRAQYHFCSDWKGYLPPVMYDRTRQPAVMFINHIHVMTRTDGVSLAVIMTPPTSTIKFITARRSCEKQMGVVVKPTDSYTGDR
jgi:hypothetical protein